MCKYCDYKDVDEHEKDNRGARIISLEDGSYTYQMVLFRYEGEKTVDKSLTLHVKVDGADGAGFSLINESVSIKYCPFCGEKL